MGIKKTLLGIKNRFFVKSPHYSLLDQENLYKNLLTLDKQELAQHFSKKRKSGGLMEHCFGMLPAGDTQSQFTGLRDEQTFLQAITYLSLCQDHALKEGRSFGGEAKQNVLDFGCGWGRITQLLALYFKSENITACDVMPAALDICSKLRIRAHYELLQSWPPSSVKDDSIDYIFGYSVFSHLSEENAGAWIREFSRILRPGGIAFLTTRPRSFFNYLKSLHTEASVPSFANGAANAFKDTDAAIKAYDRGQFCFDPMGSGGAGLTAVYGEAFIPFAYAQKEWGSCFSKIEYCDPMPAGLLDQATLVFYK